MCENKGTDQLSRACLLSHMQKADFLTTRLILFVRNYSKFPLKNMSNIFGTPDY